MNNHQAMQALLQQRPTLQQLADEAVAVLLCEEKLFAPGSRLFEEGKPLTHLYLLLEGYVAEGRGRIGSWSGIQATGAPALRRTVKAGTNVCLGIYDLLYGQSYSTSAVAETAVRALTVDAATVQRLFYHRPAARQAFVPVAAIDRLRTMPLLATLDPLTLGFLADMATLKPYPAKTRLYTQFSPGAPLYLIDHGQVRLTWAENKILWLGSGMEFGFVETRARIPVRDFVMLDHMAETTCATTLYEVDRETFIGITGLPLERLGLKLREERAAVLDFLSIFSNYSPAERTRLLGFMSHYHLPATYVIAHQGETADSLWVLLPQRYATIHALNDQGGALPISRVGGVVFFGEHALREQSPFAATIEAEPASQWLRLHWRDFRVFVQQNGEYLQHRLNLPGRTLKAPTRRRFGADYGWLQPGETLEAFERRHWIVLVRKIAPGLAILGILITPAIYAIWLVSLTNGWLNGLVWLASVIGLLQIAWGVLDFYNDFLLVTNLRVMRQEKVLLINEWRQVAPLEQVENVDSERQLLGRLLGYGKITIQTAGRQGGAIEFDFVPNIDFVRRRIVEARDRRRRHYAATGKKVIHTILENRFGRKLNVPTRVWPEDAGGEAVPENMRSWQRWWHYWTVERYAQQYQNEQIVWRQHWLILLANTFLPALFALGALVMAAVLFSLRALFTPGVFALVAILDVLAGLAALVWLAWNANDWYNDTYEISQRDVVDVSKKPLFFDEKRRSTSLSQIQDIQLSLPSPLHYLLNFGNVRMETAASDGTFTFDNVPNPRGVVEEIRRRIDLFRRQQEIERAHQRAQELPDWFEMYDHLENR